MPFAKLMSLMVFAGHYPDANGVMRQCWLPVTEDKRIAPDAKAVGFGFVVEGATPGMMYRFLLSPDSSGVIEDTDNPPLPVGLFPDEERVAYWTTLTVTGILKPLGDLYTSLPRNRRSQFKVIVMEFLDELGG